MTVRLPRKPDGVSGRGHGSTWGALIVCLAMILAMIGFLAAVLPQAVGILLVVLGFGLFAGLHYVTWGLWLNRVTDQRSELSDAPSDSSGDR